MIEQSLQEEIKTITNDFWSVNSDWFSKLGICTGAKENLGDHFVIKMCVRKFGALGKRFSKISQNIS